MLRTERSNLRQNDLAKQFKMTQSQYSKVESGKIKISFDNLYVLQMKGYDIDALILGESKQELLPCLEQLTHVEDEKQLSVL